MNFRKIIILVLVLILVLLLLFTIDFKKDETVLDNNLDINLDVNLNNDLDVNLDLNGDDDLEKEDTKNLENTIVVIETSKGDITLELFDKEAPETVKNFLSYVESEFYSGTVFHRVIEGFMIQGGGFTKEGVQKPVNDPISLENTSITGLSNLRKTIAMARTPNPNSATSQFFINTANNLSLDYTNVQNPGYAVFGKVIDGVDVVYNIERVNTTRKFDVYDDWPEDDIIIKRIYIK